MDHLVAVAQLLGHHAQRPGLVLRLLGPRDRPLVLLDRAELRRGLCPDLPQEMLGRLRWKVLRENRLRLAGAIAHLDPVGDVRRDPRAQAEGLIFREETVPRPGEHSVVGEVVPTPVLDRAVVRLRQRADLVVHATSVPSSSGDWSYRSRERTAVLLPGSVPGSCGGT